FDMTSTCSLLLLLGLAIAVQGKLHLPKIKLLQQQSQALSEKNPKNTPACFTVYKPQLDRIASQYETDYTKCSSTYNQQAALEDAKWQGARNQFEFKGQQSCRTINDCSTIVGFVETFECYAYAGSEQSKFMYTISADASEVAVEIKEDYRLIESSKTICVNNAERAYVENTTNTYEKLNSCLIGNEPQSPPAEYATTP
ncbi:hypothetical protein KR093_008183, partial [Drosophila rubida]